MQRKVYKKMGIGSAGLIAKGVHNYFVAFEAPVLENDSVCVGCFVQLADDKKHIVGASGNAITGKIVGVAIKDHFISATENTHIFKKNDIATYVSKGCVFIETKTPAKTGQYVFLKNADGALVFNDSETLADHTFTGFQVVQGTGDVINADLGFELITILSK